MKYNWKERLKPFLKHFEKRGVNYELWLEPLESLIESLLAEQKKELMESIDKMLDDAIFHHNATGSSGESVMAYQSIKTLLESLNHHE